MGTSLARALTEILQKVLQGIVRFGQVAGLGQLHPLQVAQQQRHDVITVAGDIGLEEGGGGNTDSERDFRYALPTLGTLHTCPRATINQLTQEKAVSYWGRGPSSAEKHMVLHAEGPNISS